MVLTATQIYKLSLRQLRQLCVDVGFSGTGPVRELRKALVRHLKEGPMAEHHEAKMPQASAPTDRSTDSIPIRPLVVDDNSHVGSGDGAVPVLVELMRQVPPLTTEEQESILRFVGRLNGIYALGLGDDRTFIVRILPLVSGAVLRFFGGLFEKRMDMGAEQGGPIARMFPPLCQAKNGTSPDHVQFSPRGAIDT